MSCWQKEGCVVHRSTRHLLDRPGVSFPLLTPTRRKRYLLRYPTRRRLNAYGRNTYQEKNIDNGVWDYLALEHPHRLELLLQVCGLGPEIEKRGSLMIRRATVLYVCPPHHHFFYRRTLADFFQLQSTRYAFHTTMKIFYWSIAALLKISGALSHTWRDEFPEKFTGLSLLGPFTRHVEVFDWSVKNGVTSG